MRCSRLAAEIVSRLQAGDLTWPTSPDEYADPGQDHRRDRPGVGEARDDLDAALAEAVDKPRGRRRQRSGGRSRRDCTLPRSSIDTRRGSVNSRKSSSRSPITCRRPNSTTSYASTFRNSRLAPSSKSDPAARGGGFSARPSETPDGPHAGAWDRPRKSAPRRPPPRLRRVESSGDDPGACGRPRPRRPNSRAAAAPTAFPRMRCRTTLGGGPVSGRKWTRVDHNWYTPGAT